MQKESMHWADRIALQVKQRVEKNEFLKKVVKKNGCIVYDEKTPSGTIHVGSARGWVIHDCVAKALRDLGAKAKFILSSDDMDPYDKPNKELDESWDKYLGMPFRDIPSPAEGYKSFADYYFSQATEKFREWGIDAELESTGERYEDGSFNEQIKTILDNADKVKKIYAELYGEKGYAVKLPFNVKCPECGKIATTVAAKWENEEIYFECGNAVKFAKGCSHKGWISPYNGNGKLPWKVEWAAKWPMKGVVYEIAGKDHFTKGSSRTVANRIAVDVLDYPPPLPSNGYKEGKGYEFFTVGGAKMSTSKGEGMAFKDITKYAPAQMLRYLMVKSRPAAVIDFDPYNEHDLLLLYDRFDKNEDEYFSRGGDKVQKRVYELSRTEKLPKKKPVHISLNNAATMVQIALYDVGRAIEIMKKQGMLNKPSKQDIEAVKSRLEYAKKWIRNFAPEQYKFELNEKADKRIISSLSENQKKALRLLKERLEKNDYDEQGLFNEFYRIKEEANTGTKEFFSAAYLALISKERGPKLAPFILQIGKERVIKLLEDAVSLTG
ncbi:lysine--tRNA ligase [Candidatus Woesearchaeota archaeon]|nr:lysine--tRNA ligase [Candidatus Woesearchaeota archaeon]